MRASAQVRFVAMLLLLAACSSGYGTDNGNNGNNGNNNNPPPANPGGTPVPSASVDVLNNYFNPNSVLLAAGGTVTWNWIGSGHSVTPTGSPVFAPQAPISNAPHTLSVTFSQAGDYSYICTVHGYAGAYSSGSMVGEIFVR